MSGFEAFIKFAAKEDGKAYFSPVACGQRSRIQLPEPGSVVDAYASIEDIPNKMILKSLTIEKLLAPVPSPGLPIYCVGLNFHSHAAEAGLSVTKYPPLWTKPAASLADPGETIPINQFCATSLLDYEGELVFVTSKECKDLTPKEAESCILGYTIGNDLSCRFFQLQPNSGGQFFYAKAFDKFAPIGPVLVSSERYEAAAKGRRLVTRVNGVVKQDSEMAKDMVFTPAQILSHMSQGTTIPAGTAVMTGTPCGVGAFQTPKSFLSDCDKIEVEIDGLGVLSNVVRFDGLAFWRRICLFVLKVALKLFT